MFNNFFKWIQTTFEGSVPGRGSSRRMTAFVVTAVYVVARVHFIFTSTNPRWQVTGFSVDALFILLLFGIVSASDIVQFKNGKREGGE
jgi:hypothetical protein